MLPNGRLHAARAVPRDGLLVSDLHHYLMRLGHSELSLHVRWAPSTRADAPVQGPALAPNERVLAGMVLNAVPLE